MDNCIVYEQLSIRELQKGGAVLFMLDNLYIPIKLFSSIIK